MTVYLVRYKADKTLAGIFWAENKVDLAVNVIDQFFSPSDCQIKEMPSGGLCWDGTKLKIPMMDITGENYTEKIIDKIFKPSTRPELSEELVEAIFEGEETGWSDFFTSDDEFAIYQDNEKTKK